MSQQVQPKKKHKLNGHKRRTKAQLLHPFTLTDDVSYEYKTFDGGEGKQFTTDHVPLK